MNEKVSTTLRQPRQLIAQGLAPASALHDLEKVAARYAVALTPEVVALIDPAHLIEIEVDAVVGAGDA